MRVALIAFVFFLPSLCCGDDFAELEKKEQAAQAANPFRGRIAKCSYSSADRNWEEQWVFQGETKFERKLLGLRMKPSEGTYAIKDGMLITEPGGAEEKQIKFKVVKDGFQLIRDLQENGKPVKALFKCEWQKREVVEAVFTPRRARHR